MNSGDVTSVSHGQEFGPESSHAADTDGIDRKLSTIVAAREAFMVDIWRMKPSRIVVVRMRFCRKV